MAAVSKITTGITVHVLVLVVAGFIVSGVQAETATTPAPAASHSVQKRWVPYYPYNSCFALAVVVAIPLELKGRNVYMSWNFETNFYYPYFDNVQGLVPLPFSTIDDENTNLGTFVVQAGQQRQLNDINEPETNRTKAQPPQSESNETDGKSSRKTRQILDYLMTRKRFYKIIESKLKGMGLNGRKCLLKSICEAAAHPLSTYNGVLGDMLHVVFTPSASMDEHLPAEFHDAEQRGQRFECDAYSRQCPRSILDFISVFA